MAHLWFPESPDDATAPGSCWSLHPLFDGIIVDDTAHVLRSPASDGDRWVLIAPASVRVNGGAVDTGIVVLRDRDEVCTATQRLFFSTEVLAAIVPYPGSKPTPCARCKLEIEPGAPSVACPRCRIWLHQSEDLPCWRYAPRCALCDQPTALDAGYQWTPEGL